MLAEGWLECQKEWKGMEVMLYGVGGVCLGVCGGLCGGGGGGKGDALLGKREVGECRDEE